MSKIGKKIIKLPDQVKVTTENKVLRITGPKGELTVDLLPGIKVDVNDKEVSVQRTNELRSTRAYHGLIRSLIANSIEGVVNGYKKVLKLVGTGYRVAAKGQNLSLSVGFSHPVSVTPIAGINLSISGNNTIIIEGIDKQKVGQMSADIRAIKPPEPYKGKGIRYEDEVVKRKAGKTAVSS